MKDSILMSRQDVRDVEGLLIQRQGLSAGRVIMFDDIVEFVASALNQFATQATALYAIGHAPPEILLAADKASLRVRESITANPFRYTKSQIAERMNSGNKLIYLANPNRYTGASCSLKQIEQLADANQDGLLIIDEYYFDYFGITAAPLLDRFDNLIILRSVAAAFGIYSSDCGYALAHNTTVSRVRDNYSPMAMSPLTRRLFTAALASEDALRQRLQENHDESLRLATKLTMLGIPTRITATDSLLFQVRSVKEVGNELTRQKIRIENLDGLPGLKGYLRYRLESPLSNDNLLSAFQSMPEKYYRRRQRKPLAQTLHRPPETAVKSIERLPDVIDKKPPLKRVVKTVLPEKVETE